MLLAPSDDQAFFHETTTRFLDELAPAAEVRRLREDPTGFDDRYWQRGAELGWTSLLVDESRGGGRIGDHGLVDLTLVAYELGRHAAPGPLIPTNVVAAALDADGADRWAEVLAGLLAGTAVGTWAHAEPPPHGRLGDVSLEVRVDGDEVVLHGTKRPVESAARADHLLVTGRTGSGLTQVLVPRGATGMAVAPMQTVDLTRRFDVVSFDGVRLPATAVVGEVGGAAPAVERQLQLAVVLAGAESVGAMQAGFDMTVEWGFDRFSFGRPLASYQALKHRYADMYAWLQGSHAIADEAAVAVATDATDAGLLASAAKAFIGQYGAELLQECVQLHGGIGVTFEHDIHLFLRRHTLDRALYGTPEDHRRRITDLVEAREAAA